MEYKFICANCGAKITSSTPVPPDIHKCPEEKKCKLVTKHGKDILNILNTIENCTVADAPAVIIGMREDTINEYAKYSE